MYYSYVNPNLIYCNHIWGTSSSTNINRLFVLQKIVVRIICHAKPRTHSDPFFKELKFLNVRQINTYLIGQFMYKHYNSDLPSIFDSYFARTCDVHSHDTRQYANFYELPKVRTDYCQHSFRFRGSSIWNSIMKNKVNPDGHICSFKKQLKVLLTNDAI